MALTNSLYRAIPQLSYVQGFWRMEETSGNATDQSSNAYTLTETSGTIDSAVGRIGNCRDFEAGDTGYFTIADASCPNLNITGAISMCAWIKLESLASYQSIIGKWVASGNQRSYHLLIDGANKPYIEVTTDGSTLVANTATNALSSGTWYHIGATLNQVSDQLQIYVNGAVGSASPTSFTNNIYNSTSGFTIGADDAGGSNQFDGLIDEVIIWNTCLTAAEMAKVYNITGYMAASGFSGVGDLKIF